MVPQKQSKSGSFSKRICRKLKSTILLLSFLCAGTNLYAQQATLSLNINNKTIKETLNEIERNSKYVFFFSDDINAELAKKISIDIQNQPINKILDKVLASVDISYTIKERQISLFPQTKKAAQAKQQSTLKRVVGTVTDNTGEPLIGVSVKLQGTTTGVITDIDGFFGIDANQGDILDISYVGFENQHIKIGTQNEINIRLQESIAALEELVVVGFSSQKKETVTGSVSSITTKDLLQSPQANISNALGGRIPGLISVQRSGEPGEDMSTLRIRGTGTFAGGDSQSPLIMVDGIEVSNLNDIDPNEILSLTILKDASTTAVYGVRGANGVILVTTKRGEMGKPQISLSTNVAFSDFPILPTPMHSYDYVRAYNEAQAYDYYSTLSYNPKYPAAEIEAYRTGSDPLFYPDINWYDYMLKDFSVQTQSNLNIRGGTERVKYFVSLGYFTQDGMFNTQMYDPGYDYQINLKRYNMRSNFDINVTKNLLLSLDVSYKMANLQNPNWSTKQIMESLNAIPSNSSPGAIDNKIITIEGRKGNPAGPFTRGWKDKYENNLDFSGRFTYKMDYLLKGLSLRGALSYKNYTSETKIYNDRGITYELRRNGNDGVIYIPSTDPGKLNYQATSSKYRRVYAEGGIEYNNKFGWHNIGALLLYKQSKYYNPTLKFNIPNGYQGFVGRVTYGLLNRYLAEFNMAYEGTENFAPGKRFGFFPAYSLGWIVTEEPFIPRNDIFTFFKIRGSYGITGNDKIGGDRFLYLPSTYVYSNSSYYFGEVGKNYTNNKGSDESKAGNPDLTWEKSIKWNAGFDLKMWKDKISLTLDYFTENRNNILCNRNTVPIIIGIDSSKLPAYNIGRMHNSGWDGEISFMDRIGDFSYFVKGNYTYAHNVILEMDEVVRNEEYLYRTGQREGQFFGYVANGIFNSWEEVNAAGRPEYVMANNNNKIQPGDIRYVDVNGDGKINDDDMVPIGYSNFPEIMYGFSIGASYKGFDVSVLFTGASHVSNMPSRRITRGFYEETGANEDLLKSWSHERYVNGQEIVYPRYGTTGIGHNYLTSTYWLEDASYLRLKNVEVGYSFSGKALKSIGIGNIRLYFTGSNLASWSKRLPGQDPEVMQSNANEEPYPVTRTFNVGLNVNF